MAFNPRRKVEVEPVDGTNFTLPIPLKLRLQKLRGQTKQAGYDNFNDTVVEALTELADNWDTELSEGKRRGKGQGKSQAESNGLGNGQGLASLWRGGHDTLLMRPRVVPP